MKNKIIFKTLMLKGEAGSTIVSMEKTGHVGTADIYTITFNDGSTTEISLENMSAITSVEKTSSTDTEDIYTITCADGSTQTFSVLNHNADIAAMSDDIDTIDARVDNFINSVVPNTVETLWTGSIKDVGDSATLSKAVSNFDYIDLYLLGSADSKYIRVPATQTAVDIQQQNLSDDASSNFLRLWEMGVSISGSTVSITKSIAWAWDDPNNSNPTVTANAQNSIPITRIDGVKVASDTPAEVMDIRVGADGTTYNSAGAAVRGQISDLKNTLDDNFRNVMGVFSIQFSDPSLRQYIVTNGTTVQWDHPSTSVSTNIKWAVVECEEGDKFTLNGKGGNSDRFWAFADASKNILSNAGNGASGTNLYITAPTNAKYLIINNEEDKPCYYGIFENDFNTIIANLETGVTTLGNNIGLVADKVNKLPVAGFMVGFSMVKMADGIQVSWDRIYVKTKDGEYNSTTHVSRTLTTSNHILVLRNLSQIVQMGTYSGINTTNDILLFDMMNNEITGGLFYPYYENYKNVFHYEDDTQLNVYKQVQQLANLKWTPKADVDSGEGLHPAGTEVTGVPYTSVKEYMKYVGIDVTLHTFMTAVNDEHSLLYTETPASGSGSRSAYGRTYHGVNCKAYFGTVCSGLVTTAIGSKIQFNSWEYQTFPEIFDVLNNQDIKNLKVGDVMSYNGHCGVLTNIRRNNDGSMYTLEFDEQSAPIHLGTNHTPFTLKARTVASKGVWCRYKNLDDNTKYKASPFVLVNDYLYNVGDFVYMDGISDRTFYQCKTANSDSQWTSSKWTTIQAFTIGESYTSTPPTFVSKGEKLYQCVNGHTATEWIEDNWKEIKGVVEWASYPYTYNDDIVTFAGDRAAFHSNDLIYINYAKGTYTTMQIYKDGELMQTITLPSTGYQINVSDYCASAGMYKARLTDGTNYSRYTYFEVIDTQVSAVYSGGYATVDFASTNGKPLEVEIVTISGSTVCHMPLTKEEIAKGKVVINPMAKMFAEKHIYPERYNGFSDTIYARILFAGEFGNVVNDMIELGNLTTENGVLVYPNEPLNIGSVSVPTNIMLASRMDGNNYTFSFTADGTPSITILSALGTVKWITTIPQNLVNGKTYLVEIVNGIGKVESVD